MFFTDLKAVKDVVGQHELVAMHVEAVRGETNKKIMIITQNKMI